ncbi:MAG: hypothetical protein ABWZ25_15170 [Chitinophagaceae bacterium]
MHTIYIEELQKIFKRIIEKLEFEGVNKIEIGEDLYLFIPTSGWQSYTDTPIYPGSLFDDIENLRMLVSDTARPCTYVDFDRMANVLRAISQIYNPG